VEYSHKVVAERKDEFVSIDELWSFSSTWLFYNTPSWYQREY
jgi:hypothetical protein